MFRLLRLLIVLALVAGAVVLGLAYLPGETAKDWGAKTADLGIRGARGADTFLDSFKEKWSAGTATPPAPEAPK